MSPSSVIIRMVKPVEIITKIYLSILTHPGSGEIFNIRCLYAAVTGGGQCTLRGYAMHLYEQSTLDLATGVGGGGGGGG